MGNNLEAIMKVMRLASGRAQSILNVTNIIKKAKEWIKYPLNIEGNGQGLQEDVTAMLRFCVLNRINQDGCRLFNPVVTDIGICHSFNSIPSNDLLIPSYFTESFKEAFKDDMSTESILHNGTGSDEDHSLSFYLLDPSFRRFNEEYDKRPFLFQLLMSTTNNYFNMNRGSRKIQPGQHYVWKVQALEDKPSEDLRSVPFSKRKCKFSDEVEDLDIFQVYSQTSCEFECQIKKAHEICNCYPWYVPPPPNASKSRHVLCDVDGNLCFDTFMSEKHFIDKCICLPTCHNIEFSHVEYVYPLDLNCEPHSKEYYLAQLMVENGYNSFTHVFLNMSKWDDSYTIKWFCKQMVTHMAKVTIMFDKKTYIRTSTSLKVTFTDKLAAFGKMQEKKF